MRKGDGLHHAVRAVALLPAVPEVPGAGQFQGLAAWSLMAVQNRVLLGMLP